MTGIVKSSMKKNVSVAIELGNVVATNGKHLALSTEFVFKVIGPVYKVDVDVGSCPLVV